MGFDFNKEVTNRLAETMIDYAHTDKPMSEDLPENIEEIDRVVGEAREQGKINPTKPCKDFNRKLEAILRSKGVMPDWDLEDLAQKIVERFTLRKHSWDFGLGKIHSDLLSVYEKLKDRPCVKRIIELTGTDHIPYDALLTIERIQELDELRAEGMNYGEILCEVEVNDPLSLLAFLNHLEEAHKAIVTTVKQFQELTNNSANEKEASIALYTAFEERYKFTLDRILKEGGKYAQLVAVDPKDFNLPEVWCGSIQNMNKIKVIHRSIAECFKISEFFDLNVIKHYSLRDVANLIEAPYEEVLKASHYYSIVEFDMETKE